MIKTVIEVSTGCIIIEGLSIYSENLKEECPYCGQPDCYASCDGAQADIDGLETEEQMNDRRASNGAIDGVESLVLALLSSGYDPAEDRFQKAVTNAIDAIGNNL